MIEFPKDFKEFLQLLNSKKVEYLVIGGYAVGYHGYPRATGDMDNCSNYVQFHISAAAGRERPVKSNEKLMNIECPTSNNVFCLFEKD